MFGPDCEKCGGVFPGNPNGNAFPLCRCHTPLEAEREAAFEKAMTPLEDPGKKLEAFIAVIEDYRDSGGGFDAAVALDAAMPMITSLLRCSRDLHDFVEEDGVAMSPVKCRVCGAIELRESNNTGPETGQKE